MNITNPLHKQMIQSFLGNNLQTTKRPELHAMVGIPAAGKTTFLAQKLVDGILPENHYYHNPDLIMDAIPDYQRDYKILGAEAAQQNWEIPARTIADDVLYPMALERNINIIMDMGLCREDILHMVQKSRLAGYSVHIRVIYCNLKIALQRSQKRSRHVDNQAIRERAEYLAGNIDRILSLADFAEAMDNSDLSDPFRPVSLQEIVRKISSNYSRCKAHD